MFSHLIALVPGCSSDSIYLEKAKSQFSCCGRPLNSIIGLCDTEATVLYYSGASAPVKVGRELEELWRFQTRKELKGKSSVGAGI